MQPDQSVYCYFLCMYMISGLIMWYCMIGILFRGKTLLGCHDTGHESGFLTLAPYVRILDRASNWRILMH